MAAPLDDPELREVFLEEMSRHLDALMSPAADATAWRSALHAMRGAAAMVGLDDLAAEVAALEDALRARRMSLVPARLDGVARELVARGVDPRGLAATSPPLADRHTAETPPSSPPGSVEWEELFGYFLADAQGRLASLREIFERAEGAVAKEARRSAFDEALRVLHALKGAAGMAGAHGVSRAAHAMEGAVQSLSARATDSDERSFAALERARAQVAVGLGAADGGDAAADAVIEALRCAGLLRARDVAEGVVRAPSQRSPAAGSRADEHVRVAARTVAQIAEAMGEVAFVRARAEQSADGLLDLSRVVVREARSVVDALRRIGPARPWGVPAEVIRSLRAVGASLEDVGARLDGAAARARRHGDALGRAGERAGELLRDVGQVSAGWVFDRVVHAAQAGAAPELDVRVLRVGDDTPVERALAEPLVDVLSQLVRNAVAHGVERPALRLARSKPAHALLRLEASSDGDLLRFSVEDDGEGVDLDAVRDRARLAGHLTGEGPWSEREVLDALFLPGVSTRPWASADAGRGVGLDLVRDSVRRLGGQVRAVTRRGEGTRFELSVEPRPLAQRLLPVRVARRELMLPLSRVVRVDRASAPGDVPSLASLLGEPDEPAPIEVLVRGAGGDRRVRVPGVSPPTELVVRTLPEGVQRAPWRGAAIDGSGRVVLVLDPDLLPL